ncbi:MAG: YmdB family metallophosphoesterase, partial [Acidobacteria bacterium]|nr:YmdB family metallophosphoesterase [Acidobacteriota bacterium]
MNVLAIGDVFGEAGKRAVAQWLPRLREEHDAAFVIVNVENVKAGRGVDASGVRAILEAGADCLTSGNHV